MLSTDVTLTTSTIPFAIVSLMMWYFLSICFVLLWFVASLVLATAELLSQYNVIEFLISKTTSRFLKNFRNHVTSFITLKTITYSTSIIKSTVQPYLILLHTIILSHKILKWSTLMLRNGGMKKKFANINHWSYQSILVRIIEELFS